MDYLGKDIRKKVAELHFQSGAFKANSEEPFHLGENRSPVYVRSQEFLGNVNLRNELIKHLEKIANELYFDIIACIETGGVPFASMLAHELSRPLIYLKKEKKPEHAPQIEGITTEELENKNILLFGDIVYNEEIINYAESILTNSGATVEILDASKHTITKPPYSTKDTTFLGDVVSREEIIDSLGNIVKRKHYDIIAGIESSIIPPAILAYTLNRPFIYVRKKEIEANIEIQGMKKEELEDKKILLFEDTIYSGNTIKNAKSILADLGATVNHCIVFYNWQKHDKNLFGETFLFDLTNTKLMIDYIEGLGHPTLSIDKKELDLFIKNPEEWHKEKGFNYNNL